MNEKTIKMNSTAQHVKKKSTKFRFSQKRKDNVYGFNEIH